MPPTNDEIAQQRAYYARTADSYDEVHVDPRDEHSFALAFLSGMLGFVEAESVLDLGSGTGRAIGYIERERPGVKVVGIEPVAELRAIGHEAGIPEDQLIDGDALALPYEDGAFDVTCIFAVLHHVRQPERVIAEMLRVSRKAIFISDANNFGQGSRRARWVKQSLNALGLWNVADRIRTRGKGYHISEGDGLFYSYSLFNNFEQVSQACRSVHLCNTSNAGSNAYRSARSVALFGIK